MPACMTDPHGTIRFVRSGCQGPNSRFRRFLWKSSPAPAAENLFCRSGMNYMLRGGVQS